MVATRSGVRTKPVAEDAVKKEDVVVSEPPVQRKAPSMRPKDAKASRAAKEDKQVDVEAAEVHEASMRKSTRVRKPAIKEEYEDEKPAKHKRGSRKDDLANAAATPLPKEPADEKDAGDDHEQADGHAKATNKRRKAVHAAQKGGSSDMHAPSHDASHPVRKARVSIAEAAKATKKLPWKWILLALCLAALMGAAYHTRHQWQGRLSQRVHQLEMHARSQLGDAKAYFQGPMQKELHGLAHSVRQGFHRQREDFLDGWFHIRHYTKGLWRSLFGGAQEATTIEKTCSAQLDGAALEAILAQGPAWEGLRASAQDVWAGHKEDPQKGMGVLMVGRTEAAASAATLAVQKALPAGCRSCFLAFKAGQSAHNSPDAAGAVQKELSGFLKDCPGGVVVVDNAQKLSPALLPVFINALSEQGSFEVDGKSVPAYKALYIATVQDSSDTLDQHDEVSLKRKAKKAFTSALTQRVPALLEPMATSHAEALRRRLEVVLPLQN
ncbi:hypothetical protein CVIRNUC_006970 [Coccomyxa viridis]|uniref:Uncharacterized protein n=1 Tax=Coccomyxa viridis TaxID=1274662 RepID=A0AAV1ICM3_9CHLO|nr:hypothetical protein CVIRNUC_006970 [Coccomyxa viridis]